MNHHPSKKIIEMFAKAELDDSLSAVVSAHVESCGNCRNIVKATEENLSHDIFAEEKAEFTKSPSSLSQDWQKVLSKMTKEVVHEGTVAKTSPVSIEIEGQAFDLPQSLRNLDPAKLKWISFGRGGKISRLKKSGKDSLFLIYLAANEEVPQHSHAGSEYSYVISGSFAADGTEYHSGDFSCSNNETLHTPKATSPDGCLLVSKVENQLLFFQGIFKPFNRLLWSFLNWKFTRLQHRGLVEHCVLQDVSDP